MTRIIRPFVVVRGADGQVGGALPDIESGHEVKDFRPTQLDLTPKPAPAAQVETDPKDPDSPATGSASDSGSETSEKSTQGSGSESSPEQTPTSPSETSVPPAGAAKAKTPGSLTLPTGSLKPPAAV